MMRNRMIKPEMMQASSVEIHIPYFFVIVQRSSHCSWSSSKAVGELKWISTMPPCIWNDSDNILRLKRCCSERVTGFRIYFLTKDGLLRLREVKDKRNVPESLRDTDYPLDMKWRKLWRNHSNAFKYKWTKVSLCYKMLFQSSDSY